MVTFFFQILPFCPSSRANTISLTWCFSLLSKKTLSIECTSVKEVGPRTQGWRKSIPDLLVTYCLLLGRVNDHTHLWGLNGVYICIFLRSIGYGHLLYVQYVLAIYLYTISLLEFKDLAITSCLLNIIPP